MSSSKRLGRSRPPRRSSTRWSGIVRQRARQLARSRGHPDVFAAALLLMAREQAVGRLIDAREPARHHVVVVAVAAQESARTRRSRRTRRVPALQHGQRSKAPASARPRSHRGARGGARTARAAGRRVHQLRRDERLAAPIAESGLDHEVVERAEHVAQATCDRRTRSVGTDSSSSSSPSKWRLSAGK